MTPVGTGQAVSLFMEVAKQAAQHSWRDRRVPRDELRVFHAQRFENLIALARALPTYILEVSLTGAFWREMERALYLRNDLSAHHTNPRE